MYAINLLVQTDGSGKSGALSFVMSMWYCYASGGQWHMFGQRGEACIMELISAVLLVS